MLLFEYNIKFHYQIKKVTKKYLHKYSNPRGRKALRLR